MVPVERVTQLLNMADLHVISHLYLFLRIKLLDAAFWHRSSGQAFGTSYCMKYTPARIPCTSSTRLNKDVTLASPQMSLTQVCASLFQNQTACNGAKPQCRGHRHKRKHRNATVRQCHADILFTTCISSHHALPSTSALSMQSGVCQAVHTSFGTSSLAAECRCYRKPGEHWTAQSKVGPTTQTCPVTTPAVEQPKELPPCRMPLSRLARLALQQVRDQITSDVEHGQNCPALRTDLPRPP
jgi:hypothetical protein